MGLWESMEQCAGKYPVLLGFWGGQMGKTQPEAGVSTLGISLKGMK